LPSNFCIGSENLLWEPHKPFDLIVESSDCTKWRYLVDTLCNGKAEFTISLTRIQTAFSVLEIEMII